MSDKFDMKLVIDAVTTPLLHARLSQAISYRERAALLRSLAEAALRGSHVVASEPLQEISTRAVDPPPPALARDATEPPAWRQPAKATPVVESLPAEDGELRPVNENNASEAHDVDQIADAFGGFF